ncbi:MAG: tetratricopeptide repeat protein [Actinomycetota bacterium]|nr:tetratricopeptide repeat protein [Actinomycetota bacterium]
MEDLRPEALALVQGRFAECERLLGTAAAGSLDRAFVMVWLRREQGRPAEAEGLVRCLMAEDPEAVPPRALRAAILGDLGRDGDAWREMRRLSVGGYSALTGHLASAVLLAELCAVLEDTRQAEALRPLLAPHADRWAVEPDGTACAGSVHRGLGLLSHTMGDWDDAVRHFEQALETHEHAGSPLLVAHVRRELAATLRARGDEGDWERGTELLSGAATIYHRLGVDRLADQASSVLRRSDVVAAAPAQTGVFRRDAEGWTIGCGDRLTRVAHSRGLADIAVLLSRPHRGVHVWELAASDDGQAAAEYVDRLREVDDDLASAEATGDRVGASLARVEREFVVGQLSPPTAEGAVDPVRSTVTARIRAALTRVEKADPELGRHLRHCITTGTFCSYEPDLPRTWAL